MHSPTEVKRSDRELRVARSIGRVASLGLFAATLVVVSGCSDDDGSDGGGGSPSGGAAGSSGTSTGGATGGGGANGGGAGRGGSTGGNVTGGTGAGGGSGRGGAGGSAGTSGGSGGTSGTGGVMGDVHGRLATGLDFACALDSSNEFVCWGRGLPYEAPPGAYTMLAAGSIRVCLLDQAGALLCLPEEQHDLPQGTFQSVCVGGYLSCAIDSASALVCWTSPGNELDERLIPPTGTFREVSCGQVHACAIRVDGTVTCWGIDSFGETVAPSGQFEHVAVGPSGSCGIQSGTREVQCWGDATAAPLPGRPVVRITRGYSDAASLGFGCAVDEDDQLVCWGTVEGATDAPTGSFRTVTANDNHACAAAPDGTVTCWGDLLGWADVPADLRLF